MQQNIQKNSLGHSIQACGVENGIQLTVHSLQSTVFRLSTQQARALACDLIQLVYRAEISKSLKKQKNVGSQFVTYEECIT